MNRTASGNNNVKPKTLVRNLNDVVLSWENMANNDEEQLFKLQICDEIKDWKTVYCGQSTRFRVDKLAPLTCYNFRVQTGPESDWIYFKAATDDDGPYHSVMHMSRAVKLGKTPVIRKIAQIRPHLLETENKENKTPLVQAIEVGDVQVLQLLITLGASVNTSLHFNQRTPLMVAVYTNQLQIATILIDKGADVSATDVNGLNVLHYAVDSNNIKNVKFALQVGLDINCRDNQNWTPLLRAVILNASDEVINLLLMNGADKSIEDKNGFNFEKHLSIKSGSSNTAMRNNFKL